MFPPQHSFLRVHIKGETPHVISFLRSPFLVAVLCFAVSQLIKFTLNYYETRELHWERLWGSGGRFFKQHK
jgi:hypothetical protein